MMNKKLIIILLSILLMQCRSQHSDFLVFQFSGISKGYSYIGPFVISKEKVDTSFLIKEIQHEGLASYVIREHTFVVDRDTYSVIDLFVKNYTYKSDNSKDWCNINIYRYYSQKRVNEYFLINLIKSQDFFSKLLSELKRKNNYPDILIIYLEEYLKKLQIN